MPNFTPCVRSFCFFFNDTATTEIYTLSLHDALPICEVPTLPGGRRDRFGGPVEVGEIAVPVAGHGHPHLMVEVVGPHRIEPASVPLLTPDQVRQVPDVFGDYQGVAFGPGQRAMDRRGKLGQDVDRALIHDGVRGVETESVEVVFVDPVEGVLDHVAAHRPGAGPVEIDPGSPRASTGAGGVAGTEASLVGTVRAEVVVDHIEVDRQAEPMGLVHQRAKIVGAAIAMRRSEGRYTIVAPVPPAREVAQRHQENGGHPQVREDRQPLTDGEERAFGSEGADVELIEDQSLESHARPVLVMPGERAGVDDLRGTVHPLRLEPGRRVGERSRTVDQVTIAASGTRFRPFEREEAAGIRLHRIGAPSRTLDDQLYGFRLGRPDPEPGRPSAPDRPDRGPVLRHPFGSGRGALKPTMASGGSVTVRENGRPWSGSGAASTPPKFPCPLPP